MYQRSLQPNLSFNQINFNGRSQSRPTMQSFQRLIQESYQNGYVGYNDAYGQMNNLSYLSQSPPQIKKIRRTTTGDKMAMRANAGSRGERKAKRAATIAQATEFIEEELTESMRQRQRELEEAQNELSKITVQQMREIKSFNNPPTIVKRVMEALMLLLGKDPSWPNIKKVIIDKDFLATLHYFDIKSVSKRTMRKLKENYLQEFYFQPYIVEKVSKPCTAICSWIICIKEYHDLLQKQKQNNKATPAPQAVVVPSNLQSDNEPIDIIIGPQTQEEDPELSDPKRSSQRRYEDNNIEIIEDTPPHEVLQPQDKLVVKSQRKSRLDRAKIKEESYAESTPNATPREEKQSAKVDLLSQEEEMPETNVPEPEPQNYEVMSPVPALALEETGQPLAEFVTLKNQGKFTGNGLDLSDFKSYSPIMLSYKISPRKRQRITAVKESKTAPKIINGLTSQQQPQNEQKRNSAYSVIEKSKQQFRERRQKAAQEVKQHGIVKKKGQGRINRLYEEGTAKLRKVNMNDFIKKEEEKAIIQGQASPSPRPRSVVKDQQIQQLRERFSSPKKAGIRQSTSVKNFTRTSFLKEQSHEYIPYINKKYETFKNEASVSIDIGKKGMNSIVEHTSDQEKSNKSSQKDKSRERDVDDISRFRNAKRIIEDNIRTTPHMYNSNSRGQSKPEYQNRIAVTKKSSQYSFKSSKNPYLAMSPSGSVIESKRQSELAVIENEKLRSMIEVYKPSPKKTKSRQKITSPMQNEDAISIDIDQLRDGSTPFELEEVQQVQDVVDEVKQKEEEDADMVGKSQGEVEIAPVDTSSSEKAPKQVQTKEIILQVEEPITQDEIQIEFDKDSGRLGADLEQAPMVDMFNDNNLFYSDIDTCRSKEPTILEDIAKEVEKTQDLDAVEIEDIPLEPSSMSYEPNKLKEDINDNLQSAFQSDRHIIKILDEEHTKVEPSAIQTDRIAETAKFNDLPNASARLTGQNISPTSMDKKHFTMFNNQSFGPQSRIDINQSAHQLPNVTSILSASESQRTENIPQISAAMAPIAGHLPLSPTNEPTTTEEVETTPVQTATEDVETSPLQTATDDVEGSPEQSYPQPQIVTIGDVNPAEPQFTIEEPMIDKKDQVEVPEIQEAKEIPIKKVSDVQKVKAKVEKDNEEEMSKEVRRMGSEPLTAYFARGKTLEDDSDEIPTTDFLDKKAQDDKELVESSDSQKEGSTIAEKYLQETPVAEIELPFLNLPAYGELFNEKQGNVEEIVMESPRIDDELPQTNNISQEEDLTTSKEVKEEQTSAKPIENEQRAAAETVMEIELPIVKPVIEEEIVVSKPMVEEKEVPKMEPVSIVEIPKVQPVAKEVFTQKIPDIQGEVWMEQPVAKEDLPKEQSPTIIKLAKNQTPRIDENAQKKAPAINELPQKRPNDIVELPPEQPIATDDLYDEEPAVVTIPQNSYDEIQPIDPIPVACSPRHVDVLPSEPLLEISQPDVKPLDDSKESSDEEDGIAHDKEDEVSVGQQDHYLDDSDDLDETVEVRMGKDSASRENSQESLESAGRKKQPDNAEAAWAAQPVHVQAEEDSDGQSDENQEMITIADQDLEEVPLNEYEQWKCEFQEHFCEKASLYSIRDPVIEKAYEQTLEELVSQLAEKTETADKVTQQAVEELEAADQDEFEALMSIDEPNSTVLKIFQCVAFLLGLERKGAKPGRKNRKSNVDMSSYFELIRDQVNYDLGKMNELLLEHFDCAEVNQEKFEAVKSMITDRDLWEEMVAQTSPVLIPIRLWILSAIENIEITVIQMDIQEFKKKLQLMREPFMKHLNAEKISNNSLELASFIAGLAKIVVEEIGQPGEAFNIIVGNEMDADEKRRGFGSLLAKELGVPFAPILHSQSIAGQHHIQEFEDASEQIKQMGMKKNALEAGAEVLLIDYLFQDPVIIQSADHLIRNFQDASLAACLAPFEVDNEDINEVKSLVPCKFVSAIKLTE